MQVDTNIFEGDECIVKVVEIADEEELVFYAIRDICLDYWRSLHPLDSDAAWTRDRRQRAEFASHEDAFSELVAIHIWREDGKCV